MSYDPKTKEEKCPFCEIVEGRLETPGVFWQDEKFMAFLSIDPNTEGFSCVIPKEHHGSDVMKMEDGLLQEFILATKKCPKFLEKTFPDVGRVGVLMEGTGIDHAHIKLVPMHGTGYMNKGEWKQYLSGKKFWFDTYEGWICSGGGPMANPDQLRTLSERIKITNNL